MIISVRDVIDLADRGKEFRRGIKRSRLEALDAALRKTMPAWKDFDRALEPTTSPDIESRSRRLVGDLEVLVKAFEDNNLDPEQLQTVAKAVGRASAWDEHFEAEKAKYKKLSPQLVQDLEEFHQQVKERLKQP